MGLNFFDGKGLYKKLPSSYFTMHLKKVLHFLIPQKPMDLTPMYKLWKRIAAL